MIASYLTPKNITTGILHIYFIFTTLGIIINNKILTTNTKKYFSIVLFNMDAKNFMKANFWSDRIINFILHSICLWFLIKSPSIFIFTIFMFLGRFLGERINLLYYKKYKMPIIYNYTIYWAVLFLSLGACLLPLIDTQVSKEVVLVIDMIMIPIAIVCYYGLVKIDNYKLIYKRMNTKVAALNSNQSKDYSRQAIVDIKEKDKRIDEKKLKGKKGYDLFNTIFFERLKPFSQSNDQEIKKLSRELSALTAEFIASLNKSNQASIHNTVLKERCVIVAKNLTPASLLCLRTEYISAVILEEGLASGHLGAVLREL